MAISMHSYIMEELPEEIVGDIKDLYIFNEADLQSRVYFRLQRTLNKMKTQRLLLNKPSYYKRGRNIFYPDFVVIDKYGNPKAAMELKFVQPDRKPQYPKKEMKNFKKFKTTNEKIKKAYFMFIYDRDKLYDIPFEQWMKHYFFSIPINMRRNSSRRLRYRYYEWRDNWELLYHKIKES